MNTPNLVADISLCLEAICTPRAALSCHFSEDTKLRVAPTVVVVALRYLLFSVIAF